MPAITDKITRASNGTRPVPTTLTATRAVGATTISCGALTGWPTAAPVHFIIYTLDTSGNKVAGSQVDCKGIVSGTSIGSVEYKAGTDNGHSIGAVVEAAPTAAYADELADLLGVSHEVTGALKTSAVQTALGLGTDSLNGWEALGYAPNSVTHNGNRSYTCVFNSVDLTGTLSAGMRLRFTRTVAAPYRSTSLNGTTQYYSKSSPSGMTFTDDFVVGAWIKLTSYANGGIVTRYNGTSGWVLDVQTTGQIRLTGFNASGANASYVQSQQSVPLNRWVYVVAQLDMSTFTATATTSYVMIDGVDVPATVARTGTNPTALIQAGNLEVGSYNGGNGPLAGKIAQAFVSSAKITQANVRLLMGQGLTPALVSTHSIISAYSFDNAITDINTTNANNLTASGSAVATNADSPFAQAATAGTLEYAIISVAPTFSTNTTVEVQVPEGSALPTSGGISAVSYATVAVPYGFPRNTDKWTLYYSNPTRSSTSAPGVGTWYNHGALTVPIGAWEVSIEIYPYTDRAAAGTTNARATFSTAGNSQSDSGATVAIEANNATGLGASLSKKFSLNLAAVTVYYLNYSTPSSGASNVYVLADVLPTAVRLKNAYL